MKRFEKHSFIENDRCGLIGSFIEKSSVRYESNVEVVFSKLEPEFHAPPHIHIQTKTVVIVLDGGITFSIDSKFVKVQKGEYIVFEKGSIEEIIFVEPNTQNLTIHTPSVLGGDKKVL